MQGPPSEPTAETTAALNTQTTPLEAQNAELQRLRSQLTALQAERESDVAELVQTRALMELRTKLLKIIVQSRRDLGELLGDMIHVIEAAYPGLMGSVLLVDADGKHLRHLAAPSLPPAYNAAADGLEIGPAAGSCGTAAYRAEEVIVADIANDPLWAAYRAIALSHGLAASFSEPILSADGKVLGTFAMYWPTPKTATASDLSAIRMVAKVASMALERHQADEWLRASERRYQDWYDNAPDMFVSVDGATGCILNCNQALANTLGRAKQELMGQPVFSLYHPDSLAAAQAVFQHFLTHGEVRNNELQLQRKDGTAIDVSLNTTAVRDAQGKVLYSRSIWRDITEQKRTDAALVQTQRMLNSLLDHSPAIIAIKDTEGKYLLINHLFETLFNITPAQVIGKTDFDLFPQPTAEAFRRNDVLALEAEHAVQIEETAPASDGPHDYLSVKFKLKDATGHVFGTGGIFTDITPQKRVARQAQVAQQLLNEAFERVTDSFVALDTDWRFTYVNSQAAAFFGRPADQLIGKQLWTEFSEQIGLSFQKTCLQVMADQKPVRFEDYYPPDDRWYLNVVYPSPQGLSIYFQDITPRKKAEQALEAHQSQLEQTVQERTAELSERIEQMRRFALLTANRELRIQELRKENEALRLTTGPLRASTGALLK